jgi:hypothetical protein
MMLDKDEWGRSLRTMGLPADAAMEQIQAAYRKLVRKYHPDVNRAPQAAGYFREIVEAYRTASGVAHLREAACGQNPLLAVRADPLIGRISTVQLKRWQRTSQFGEVRAGALAALGVRREVPIEEILDAARQDPALKVRAVARLVALERSGRPLSDKAGAGGLDQALRAAFQFLQKKGRKPQYSTVGAMN